jgi:hypothetical protein
LRKISGVNLPISRIVILLGIAAFALAAGPSTQPASAPAAPAANLGPNLLVNGDFEHAMDGWDNAKDNGMSLVSPEAAHSGGFGLRVTDDDPDKGSSLASERFPAVPGQTFEVRFWGRIMSGKDTLVYIQFFDNKNKQLTTKESGRQIQIRVIGGQWREYQGRGVAPEGTASARVWIHTINSGKAIADFDDFTFCEVK